MKTHLVMLPDQTMILVSDEEQKKGDPIIHKVLMDKFQKAPDEYGSTQEHWWKIIAGIPGLPTIDLSALSEEECKKIGWVDWIKHWENLNRQLQSVGGVNAYAFEKGFKAAQSLNDKKVDIEPLITWFGSLDSDDYYKCPKKLINETILKIQSYLPHPKVFNVEVEMDVVRDFNNHGNGEIFHNNMMEQPKITNNSIKIVKLI